MELENALFAWVKTQVTLTDILGVAPAATRFFEDQIPAGGKTPASVQQRTGTERQALSCTIDGAVRISLQVDHYARTKDQVKALAKAFRVALRPENAGFPVFMGGNGDSPSDGIKVKDAFLDNEFDADDIEPGLLRRTQLWSFWIREP